MLNRWQTALKIFFLLIIFLSRFSSSGWAELIYQNFEDSNGTPVKYTTSKGSVVEYGWSFGGAVAHLSNPDDPVYSGKRSWVLTIPKGQPITHGTGISSQFQTFNANFLPECHDRLSFRVWSDPSKEGEHTVMVKFFESFCF